MDDQRNLSALKLGKCPNHAKCHGFLGGDSLLCAWCRPQTKAEIKRQRFLDGLPDCQEPYCGY